MRDLWGRSFFPFPLRLVLQQRHRYISTHFFFAKICDGHWTHIQTHKLHPIFGHLISTRCAHLWHVPSINCIIGHLDDTNFWLNSVVQYSTWLVTAIDMPSALVHDNEMTIIVLREKLAERSNMEMIHVKCIFSLKRFETPHALYPTPDSVNFSFTTHLSNRTALLVIWSALYFINSYQYSLPAKLNAGGEASIVSPACFKSISATSLIS